MTRFNCNPTTKKSKNSFNIVHFQWVHLHSFNLLSCRSLCSHSGASWMLMMIVLVKSKKKIFLLNRFCVLFVILLLLCNCVVVVVVVYCWSWVGCSCSSHVISNLPTISFSSNKFYIHWNRLKYILYIPSTSIFLGVRVCVCAHESVYGATNKIKTINSLRTLRTRL